MLQDAGEKSMEQAPEVTAFPEDCIKRAVFATPATPDSGSFSCIDGSVIRSS